MTQLKTKQFRLYAILISFHTFKEKINKLSDDITTKGQQGKFNFDGFNCLNEILFKIT
jgi:hypothetical protein